MLTEAIDPIIIMRYISTCCQSVRDAIKTVSSPVIVIGDTIMKRQSM